MAESTKILAQATSKSAITLLYKAPSNGSAVISTFVACNTGTAATFRMACAQAGYSSVFLGNYIYYDESLAANETLMATAGITLGPGEKIYAMASTTTVSFTLFGVERT